MPLQATLHKKTFHFHFDVRTSRGIMKERVSWFIKLGDTGRPEVWGIGECAPLPGLSNELDTAWENKLSDAVESFNQMQISLSEVGPGIESINDFVEKRFPTIKPTSSLLFAFETAFLDLMNGGTRKVFPCPFIEGKEIPINGLIWMGGMDFMLQQVEIKIRDGYRCLKLKVGGLDFEKECDILQYIRRKYFRDDITIRLDANGAFKADEALYKLQELSKFKIHSIEQPLKAGSEFLPELCRKSPIPVSLDEELIGIFKREGKAEILNRIKPQFIILKPTLHGGLFSCKEWIDLAKENNTGWWITSALESNIGLNAIAQFTSLYPIETHQGLGTGTVYDDNIASPLQVSSNGLLSYNRAESWSLDEGF